jgi:hypothetical protein
MIQGVINRMATNSLQIKCWAMAVVGVMITFISASLVAVGLFPAIVFMFLDAKYLSLEKAYRDLYDEVRIKEEAEIDFSMKFSKVSIKYGLKSWSVYPFYLMIFVIIIGVAIYRM